MSKKSRRVGEVAAVVKIKKEEKWANTAVESGD